MGRKVCFTDINGQYGTCIRDDEDCTDCRVIPNYVLARKQVNTLNKTAYGLRDLAMSFAKTGNGRVATDLDEYANDIDSVIVEIERNLNQVNRNYAKHVMGEEQI